ncbi:18815_t:CDS:1, partial [Gigaspora rosea]
YNHRNQLKRKELDRFTELNTLLIKKLKDKENSSFILLRVLE